MLPLVVMAACAPGPAAPASPAVPSALPPTAAAGAPSAAAQPAQPTSTELNLYGWTDYVPQQLLDDFTAKYGIKVNYDTYSSNEEMLAKLQAGASGYDVVIPSDYTVAIMLKQDMLEALDMSQIPNFANVDPRFANQYYDPATSTAFPISGEPPRWPTTRPTCLSSPRAGRTCGIRNSRISLVMLDDSREVPGMALQVLGFDKNSTDPTAAGSGQAEADRAQAEHPALQQRRPGDVSDHRARPGQAWSTTAMRPWRTTKTRTSCTSARRKAAESGLTTWRSPRVRLTPDAAMAFMNFVLEPKESVLITKEFPYSSPNAAGLEYMKTSDPARLRRLHGILRHESSGRLRGACNTR